MLLCFSLNHMNDHVLPWPIKVIHFLYPRLIQQIVFNQWSCVFECRVAGRWLSALVSWPTNMHTLTPAVHHAGSPPERQRVCVCVCVCRFLPLHVWGTWGGFYRCMCVFVCERGTLWDWFYLIRTYKSTLLEQEMWDILFLFAPISDSGIDSSYLFLLPVYDRLSLLAQIQQREGENKVRDGEWLSENDAPWLMYRMADEGLGWGYRV